MHLILSSSIFIYSYLVKFHYFANNKQIVFRGWTRGGIEMKEGLERGSLFTYLYWTLKVLNLYSEKLDLVVSGWDIYNGLEATLTKKTQDVYHGTGWSEFESPPLELPLSSLESTFFHSFLEISCSLCPKRGFWYCVFLTLQRVLVLCFPYFTDNFNVIAPSARLRNQVQL